MAVIYGDDLANDLSGTAGADSIYGLGGDDTLIGGSGDSLYGGQGDDVYFIERSGNVNTMSYRELDGEGCDTVNLKIDANATFVKLPDFVENLNIYGTAQSVAGNQQDNVVFITGSVQYVNINGQGGDDVLFGTQFDDVLNGGVGVDGMSGGLGDDVYFVDDQNDIIVERSGEGRDFVECSANKYRLASNVEDLELFGDSGQLMAYGNTISNTITSYGDYSRIVSAGGGADTVIIKGVAGDILIGGGGNDSLQAGLGDDVYRTSGAFGHDEITDIGGDDAVEFDVSESTLWFSKSGNDLNVSVIGTQNGVTIKNWYSDSSAKIEEFYAGTGKMLTAAKVDTLVSAMSAFAQPTTAALPANIQTALAPTLAAAWQ